MNRLRAGKYLLRESVRLSNLGEELPQALHRLPDVDGDGLRGDAEGLRDLVIARLLLPAEQEHLALAARQGIHGLLDRGSGLCAVNSWSGSVARAVPWSVTSGATYSRCHRSSTRRCRS